MATGISAAAPTCAARRKGRIIQLLVALALALAAVPTDLYAETGTPLIRIPPARLPPLAEAPASAVATPRIQPAPRAVLPMHVQVLRDPQGTALAMYGSLTGEATSAAGVIMAIFSNSEAFDPTPVVRLMVADEGDRRAQALFTGTVHGAPIAGVAVAALGDHGGDATVYYGIADTFGAAFRRLRQALAVEAGPPRVILSPLHLADGSEIGLPAGWHVTAQGPGAVDLRGPQAEFISLGAVIPVFANPTATEGLLPETACCDARAAFETLFPKIAAAAQSRGLPASELVRIVEAKAGPAGGRSFLILSDLHVGGEEYTYFGRPQAVAGVADPWTFALSGVMAPRALFAGAFPTLMQIWRSYRSSEPALAASPAPEMIAGMPTVEALLGEGRPARPRTGADGASTGWEPLIACIAAAAKPKGRSADGCGQAPPDTATAEKLLGDLSAESGRSWRIVPLSELR